MKPVKQTATSDTNLKVQYTINKHHKPINQQKNETNDINSEFKYTVLTMLQRH